MKDARLVFKGCDQQEIDVLATSSGIDIEMHSDFEDTRMFLYWKEWDRIKRFVEENRRQMK